MCSHFCHHLRCSACLRRQGFYLFAEVCESGDEGITSRSCGNRLGFTSLPTRLVVRPQESRPSAVSASLSSSLITIKYTARFICQISFPLFARHSAHPRSGYQGFYDHRDRHCSSVPVYDCDTFSRGLHRRDRNARVLLKAYGRLSFQRHHDQNPNRFHMCFTTEPATIGILEYPEAFSGIRSAQPFTKGATRGKRPVYRTTAHLWSNVGRCSLVGRMLWYTGLSNWMSRPRFNSVKRPKGRGVL
ncbi:hypothetical protein SISNIDRAFT_287193 [Sistotremastrum niveocremeum HHB9708]|uniref:Uncharacterized protein n=1 Tax=Sistotremastrum niveocremeum HHB9708 TaxID=1314777 RepID=A0A164YEV2_9AGAM|nr:hypothetical protein SISNIDRAFT_287193 [Sistotremastrum niveocremeum HHB9708]